MLSTVSLLLESINSRGDFISLNSSFKSSSSKDFRLEKVHIKEERFFTLHSKLEDRSNRVITGVRNSSSWMDAN